MKALRAGQAYHDCIREDRLANVRTIFEKRRETSHSTEDLDRIRDVPGLEREGLPCADARRNQVLYTISVVRRRQLNNSEH